MLIYMYFFICSIAFGHIRAQPKLSMSKAYILRTVGAKLRACFGRLEKDAPSLRSNSPPPQTLTRCCSQTPRKGVLTRLTTQRVSEISDLLPHRWTPI